MKRKASGMSQEKLAERAALSTVFISNIECAKQTISVDALARIAKALGTTLRELFTEL